MESGKWRKGERLPGEPAGDTPQHRALITLVEADPHNKLDLAQAERPVVAIHFRPNYGG